MITHQPPGYQCPFCNFYNLSDRTVYKNEETIAFVSSHWWPNNKGHVIVIPREHFENIYDIPDDILAQVYQTAKKIAIAVKETYHPDGTSMRQHNEPAGNQNVWHFHVHVFPRYENDNLYESHKEKTESTPEKRQAFVDRLRSYFSYKEK